MVFEIVVTLMNWDSEDKIKMPPMNLTLFGWITYLMQEVSEDEFRDVYRMFLKKEYPWITFISGARSPACGE